MADQDDLKVLPDQIPDIKFNLDAQEQFGNDKGVVLEHWAAIPSAIGQKDRGDYRRPGSLDTISENGFLYRKVGEIVGSILGNSRKNQFVEGGVFDNSTAQLMMPKFYKETKDPKHKEIALLPGDRLYAKNIELDVDNYQKVEYNPNGTDLLQFPAKCVLYLIDSNNKEYTEGIDFKISENGNIKWINGGNNPGVDPQTGHGRIYGIRYKYLAFWYVNQLLNEIRVTNLNNSENPTRMPYHAVIQREYVYHNRNRSDEQNDKKENITSRTNETPQDNINPDDFDVQVAIRNFDVRKGE